MRETPVCDTGAATSSLMRTALAADALLDAARTEVDSALGTTCAAPTPAIPMTPALLLAVALAVTNPAPAQPVADSVRTDVEVRTTVLRHATDVRRCYQDEGLRRNPSLAGQVELELTILPTGHVDEASVPATSLAGPGQKEVTVCIATRARNWRFQRGPYAVETVVFPFVLSPEDAARTGTAASADD